MHVSPNTVSGIIGAVIVLIVCFDVFHSIIVPRVTLKRLRIAPIFIGGFLWPLYRAVARKLPAHARVTSFDMFAPLAFISLLAVWFFLLLSGFALCLYADGANIAPPITDLTQAFYFAGTSLLTVGFGDMVAKEWPARFVVLSAAILGLILMALVVSLLFSMQSYLQQREQVVNTLMSRAGLPASGVVLLMRYRELDITNMLGQSFIGWEAWAASILESHRSYPLLTYFRSNSHENSWLATLGATLDAGSLVLTAVGDHPVGEADLHYWMATTTLRGICDYIGLSPVDGAALSREDFDMALSLLKESGYNVRTDDAVWTHFKLRRSGYMRYLIPLSKHFELPSHVWLPNLLKLPPLPQAINN